MRARYKVELFEHETVRVGDPLRTQGGSTRPLRAEEHEALARFNDAHGGRFFRLGHKSITTTQFVGYVEVGALAIEILPKADRAPAPTVNGPMWRAGLLEMLRAATDLRLESPSAASQAAGRSTLIELIVRRFIDELERLLHQGLAKGYRDEETNSPAFRGKLLFASQIRENAVRADRFYVRYGAFDRDIMVNRALREALSALDGLALSGAVAARAAACSAAFPEVRALRMTSETFARITLSRSTARYRDALMLAELILSRSAPLLRKGGAQVFAILFDMNSLWESYVGSLFRRAAGRRFQVTLQEQAPLWLEPGARARIVKPDFIVRRTGEKRVLLIADTKWKLAPDGVPSDDELKQMFVYNELFGAPRAVLLYPAAGAATGRDGAFMGRPSDASPPHNCATLHLGVATGNEWGGAQMQAQITALLESLDAGPADAP